MQILGVTLILFNIGVSSSPATVVDRAPRVDGGDFRRVPESMGRRKTRRMMMGLGSEIGWVTPEFEAGPGYSHVKRERSPEHGTAGSKPDSFRDSVIVLRNHKRSESQQASGPVAGSAASKSDSFRDSVIVLRNHKRSEGEEIISRNDALQPKIVVKKTRRSPASSSESNSSVRDSTIVLRQHKRSGPDTPKHSVSDSSIVLKKQQGQQPASTAASKTSVQDSSIVLRNHRRAEEQEVDQSRDANFQPKIVLMDHNQSKADSVSQRSLHDSSSEISRDQH